MGFYPILGGLTMSLPDLFLRESTNHDASMVSLPQDLDLWPEVIVKNIYEKFPVARTMSLKVSFLKKNEEMGVATGSVEVTNKKLNKSLYIPVIIKNFKMYPLDIVMVPDKSKKEEFDTRPLVKSTIEEYFFNNRVFDSLSKPVDKLKQYFNAANENLVFPPRYRHAYASAQIVDALSGSVDKKDLENVKSFIEKEASYLVGYEKRSNLGVIKKLLNVKVAEKSQDDIIKNVSIIKKDLSNKYKVVSVSDEAYSPIVSELNKEELKNSLSDKVERPEDTIHEVEQNGERMVFNDLKPGPNIAVLGGDRPENYELPKEKVSDANVLGCYKVQDKNGVFHEGVVIPNIVQFDMKTLPHKIFVNNRKSAFQTKIMGIPVEHKHPMKELPFSDINIGLSGTFVYANKKNAIATTPLTIKSIFDSDNGKMIVAETFLGSIVKIKMDFGMVKTEEESGMSNVGVRKIVKVNDYYVLPYGFKFVSMEDLTTLVEEPIYFTEKMASWKMAGPQVRIIHTGHSQFALKGGEFRKMAHKIGWDVTNLNPSQTVFLLAANKCPLDKIAEALNKAGKSGESKIKGLKKVKWHGKSFPCKKASAFKKEIDKIKVNLFKEASFFEDSQVVDSILSLNFINSQNVNKFINFIPLFEQVTKMLAQTLLGCRLGMKEIPEEATVVAMKKMVEVLEGLQKLKLRLKEE
jgi:hypothetical protein